MAMASVRCPLDCGPRPAKHQCLQRVGKSQSRFAQTAAMCLRPARQPTPTAGCAQLAMPGVSSLPVTQNECLVVLPAR